MILTCPSCATRYFVKDEAVPTSGRAVRCASCGTEWRAGGDAAAMTLAPEPAVAGRAAAAAAKPLPTAYRAKVQAQRQTRQAMAAGVVWAVLGAAFAVVALAAVLFRVEVVKAFPRANAAYAAIRMPVNPTGLALEGVTGGPGLENGRQMLVVAGALRNVEAGPRAAAALRVSLFDKAGRRAASQVIRPGGPDVAPGEARAFRAVFYDPPLSAAEFGVDFAWDVPPAHAIGPKRAHVVSPPPAEPAAAPRSPVTDAAPLPANSPYALHPAPEPGSPPAPARPAH